ncbi:MAG: CHRD domain-containing protein [Candidatus Pacearchaeota archaeon]
MKNKKINFKNISSGFITILLLIGMIGFVNAIGSSYSNGYNNDIPNNNNNNDNNNNVDETITYQELNQNNVNEIIEENNDKLTSLTYSNNNFFTETYRIYSAFSFLQGTKEIPSVHSDAFAIGEFLIDTKNNRLTYNILEFNVVNETKARILGPASSRTNSNNTLLTLPTTAGSKTGIWNYPESIETDLLNGRTYVNIYTSNNPNGEIRGQITISKSYVVRRYVNAPNPNIYNVAIRNSTFIPNLIKIKRGDTVIWKNYDYGYNNVKSNSGYELNSARIPRGYFYSHRFNNVGNYSYHSTYHPGMNGTVIVTN